jgi:hypothetical protein
VDELLYWSGKRMKFDEYLQDELAPKRLPSIWVTNTKFVFQSDDGSLAILDTANDSVTTLVTNHTMVRAQCWLIYEPQTWQKTTPSLSINSQRQLNVQGYQCTSDLRYVLFTHNVKYVSMGLLCGLRCYATFARMKTNLTRMWKKTRFSQIDNQRTDN